MSVLYYIGLFYQYYSQSVGWKYSAVTPVVKDVISTRTRIRCVSTVWSYFVFTMFTSCNYLFCRHETDLYVLKVPFNTRCQS